MQWPLIKLIGRFIEHARNSTVHLFKSWGYQKSANTKGIPQNQKPFCSVLIPNVTDYMVGSLSGALRGWLHLSRLYLHPVSWGLSVCLGYLLQWGGEPLERSGA